LEDAVAEALGSEVESAAAGLRGQANATSPSSDKPPPEDTAGLTPREVEVLRLLATGLSDREIGDALAISPRTAMRHVANIYAKLDVSSRAAATSFATRHGLV
jgi:DNA-binding NarL/FixJ family response regulator